MSKLESSRLNGVDVIAKTYTHTHIHTHTAELRFFAVIDSYDLEIYLISSSAIYQIIEPNIVKLMFKVRDLSHLGRL